MTYIASARPFDFMVPFWGKRYREYFVDLCLPSLLAPNNLSLLRVEDGHRFLIATTVEDWNAIEYMPIMSKLRRHATPIWVAVDGPPSEAQADSNAGYGITIEHQNYCQKKLLQAAYPRGAYGSLLFPDNIFSNCMVASLIKLVHAGYQLAVLPALRQAEEDTLDDLRRLGYLPFGTRLALTGEALTIPQRIMADLAVRHLHPEMSPYDQGKSVPRFALPFRYWRVPGDRGLLIHTFYASAPILMDFKLLAADHADCLDRGHLENVYVSHNFAGCDHIHVIQDSDEFAVLSLTPKAVNRASPAEQDLRGPWWARDLPRMCNIRESMQVYAGASRDVIKRDLFRVPIRWHRAELDRVWEEEERRIERLISRAVGDYYRISRPPNRKRFPSRPHLLDVLGNPRGFILNCPGAAKAWFAVRFARELSQHLWLAVRGNAASKHWLMERIHRIKRRPAGDRADPPEPGARS
jgi:hypothetical protein